jgi:nucleotide-binding universal stress UspA family protein
MRILVPVDSSEFAFKALEKAMQMAKQLGAQASPDVS